MKMYALFCLGFILLDLLMSICTVTNSHKQMNGFQLHNENSYHFILPRKKTSFGESLAESPIRDSRWDFRRDSCWDFSRQRVSQSVAPRVSDRNVNNI